MVGRLTQLNEKIREKKQGNYVAVTNCMVNILLMVT